MPTVADVEILAKSLGSILAGKPRCHGALILAPMQTEPEWLPLAETGDRERSTALLFLGGEQLVGAKQNRIL